VAKRKRANVSKTTSGQTPSPIDNLPPGVTLRNTLAGHTATVLSVAFDPQGEMLASGSADNTVSCGRRPAASYSARSKDTAMRSTASPLIRRAAHWPAGMSTRRSSCGRQPAASCSAHSKDTRALSKSSLSRRTVGCWHRKATTTRSGYGTARHGRRSRSSQSQLQLGGFRRSPFIPHCRNWSALARHPTRRRTSDVS
jgi:WD40 repeat protein